jgi:hypothetical protein
MKHIRWYEQEPVQLKMNLVHHCSPTTSEEYVYTIQMLDEATTYGEKVAVPGHSYLALQDGFCRSLARISHSQ